MNRIKNNSSDVITSALSLTGISKSYGKNKVFSDLTLEFDHRGLYLITGPSGCGKTTLFRIIAGLDTDYEGEMNGGGLQSCAVSFQEYRLFPAVSAFENVYIATRGSDSEKTKKAMDALLAVGFDPDDFEKLPSELSGGMKQRVSIARAIASDKPILLFDEPTKELDAALREKLYAEFTKLSKSKLVIIITHLSEDMEKLSDKIIDMSQYTK